MVSESPSLHGKTVVITGANTGVGRATALALSARGASLVLLCRSESRAADVVSLLSRSGRDVSLVVVDLADLGAVARAAGEVRALTPRIDVLLNNAGVGGAHGVTVDGFELAFGVNHLGHYLLTRALVDVMAPGGRIVHLSSGSHARVRGIDFDAIRRPTRTLTGVREYAVSKLAVMLFHHELARRLATERPDLITLAADPGDVASEAWRHVPRPFRWWLVRGMKSPEEGALTPLHCATAPLADASGGFYVDRRRATPSAPSLDIELARTLWDASARFTGLRS